MNNDPEVTDRLLDSDSHPADTWKKELRVIPYNDTIATEPFVDTGMTTVGDGGFKRPARESTLVSLKVVFGGDDGAIETVYVAKQDGAAPWAQKVFELDGKEFILVPLSAIKVVKAYRSTW
jgi:hypothetical protein